MISQIVALFGISSMYNNIQETCTLFFWYEKEIT